MQTGQGDNNDLAFGPRFDLIDHCQRGRFIPRLHDLGKVIDKAQWLRHDEGVRPEVEAALAERHGPRGRVATTSEKCDDQKPEPWRHRTSEYGHL
jgi:hypothetical protein